jgi:K+-transporting ATPase KdpF subunit
MRRADGRTFGRFPMIENILLTIVSFLVLVYLFVALIRPEVF